MKKCFMVVCAATLAHACGPHFPGSYFNYEENVHFYGGLDFLNSTRPGLKLIGEHFYPEWAGRHPRRNAIKTAEAHRLDFKAAAQREGLDAEPEEAAWARYTAFTNGLLERLEAGEKMDIPKDAGAFTEFYFYTLGRDQFRARPENPEPEAWLRLLVLPPEARRYRTTWVFFGMTLAAKTFKDADIYLREFRDALDAGFADTATLEESILRQLVRREPVAGLRWLPLVMAAYDNEHAYYNDFFGSHYMGNLATRAPDFCERMLEDRVGREILLTYDDRFVEAFLDPATGGLKASAGPLLCADRLAWMAFSRGDFKRGRALLATAPGDSMIGLFWEARFARGEGDYARSAALLKRWLEFYQQRRPPSFVRAKLGDDYYSYYEQASVLEFPQIVQGELGAMLVKKGDMLEALHAFDRAGNPADAALVAERLVPLDDVLAYLSQRPWDGQSPWWHGLAARRLMREGRVEAAAAWFEHARTPPIKEYRWFAEQKGIAEDPRRANDERALAYYNMARVLYTHGRFLMGAEVQPDHLILSDVFFRYYNSLEPFINWLDNEKLKREVMARRDAAEFHSRGLAMDYAEQAADFAENRDLRVAALLLGGWIPRGHDPRRSDVFFKRLCKLRPHPVAEAANARNWFTGDMFNAMHKDAAVLRPRSLEEVVALVRGLTPPENTL